MSTSTGESGSSREPTVQVGVVDRRAFMAYFSALGIGGTAFPALLWAQARDSEEITLDMLPDAEAVAGLSFTDEERELMLEDLNDNLEVYRELQELEIENGVAPALRFEPTLPGTWLPVSRTERRAGSTGPGAATGEATEAAPAPDIADGEPAAAAPAPAAALRVPARLEEVAFWPVSRLAELLRARQVTSEALTRMYLQRLERHGQRLECVVTLTPELALEQARRADGEIEAGNYRGPLHGVPWGAKDLLSVGGYPTTWGAEPYRDQVLEGDATVVRRLEEAGAVLVAKLTLGALAWGDVWFGGTTKNPWNLEEGSSGSSAGSAAATVAGLVGFAIGSETLGSIVSPSTRCGASGFRPTFGRVSRHGAMALSWSMDKLGPICRTAEDCALVLDAIHGPDGRDSSVRDVPFTWDPDVALSDLRIGYFERAFEGNGQGGGRFDRRSLEVLRGLAGELVSVDLPRDYPSGMASLILNVEAAAAFDELTRSGRDDLLVRQVRRAWPNAFRQARLVPAVEYVQANRARTLLMEDTARALEGIDVFITPSFGGNILGITNLTGHPQAVLPNGFEDDGTPTSISFVGNLWRDAETLAVASAYQEATDFHRRHPPEFA